MVIQLFTDFGTRGPYLGQVTSVLAESAPAVPVINLISDAPFANPRASAYLLSALSAYLPAHAVVIAVVDPGVGSERKCLCLNIGSRWYLGPDNGLLALIAKNSSQSKLWEIDVSRFAEVSNSFHGRDIFAPTAAAIANGLMPEMQQTSMASMIGFDWSSQLAEIIYIDGYGNAMTGLRADSYRDLLSITVGEITVQRAKTFSDVSPGSFLFFENSIGLLEIARNGGNAAQSLNLELGQAVKFPHSATKGL